MLNMPYHSLGQMNYPVVVFSVQGDVNGDGIPDNVSLIGNKTIDSPYIQNITLAIQDGRTCRVNYVPLKSNAGYNPTLFLGDFTGNGIKDIFISITSGGSGGITYYYIYSDVGNIPKLLFDYNVFNEIFQYQVIYKDYYKVNIINITQGIEYIIDISNKDQNYLNEIYNSDGTLKEPIEGWVNPLNGLYPIDFDTNGVYELLAYQRISGRYAADALGNIQTTLQWNGRKFILANQYVAILGASIKCV